jgi:putative photosynthetic complex assembly protein
MQEVPQLLSRPFPRGPLLGAFLLIGLVLACVTAVRLSGVDIAQPTGRAIAVREFHFVDRADGGVTVTDAAAGDRVVEIVQPGTGYFLRATLRGMARQRYREDMGEKKPFRLTAWNDGRLTLDDPATGRHIDLEAFGETNEKVFAQLLTTPPEPRAARLATANP